MIISELVKDTLSRFKIQRDEGILYLLAVYLNLKVDFIPDNLKLKVHATNIFEFTSKEGIKWNMPLFEGGDIHFDWVKEFRSLFSSRNRERAGSLTVCTTRMKKFFSLYPFVRKDDVIQATKLYLESVKDPTYILKSQNFIFDDKFVNSELLDWVNDYLELKDNKVSKVSIRNVIQE